ncbi:glycosyltransferase family 2 protein [Calothrix sp. UHCC 0171]|uniref:glycosyltransferase family 2 protein n=1 Tax=Calothrix sp. UHCC 0171 TaxID=3110245 RepID=UPI002B207E99|nr:glycosyltransferase family 2 protein [Calothrix sp. UHCC 0171]MEA5573380.1 glycosyltransferase family 2 protein [Calothrix sp. UHCC 0171]
MKISIITPTFNSENTIAKTITSVISQPHKFELEYIIVDGNSTDKTCEIITKYSDYIDIFISEPDSGAYDAMNKGISLASGDIIGIINSDDWYNHSAIEIVEKIFASHPEIDILYSPIDNYYQGKYVATFLPGDLEKLLIRFTLNHPSCFIKTSAYQLVGLYNTNFSIAADYDLILRLFLANCNFHYVDTPLAAYSLNGMSSSTNPITRAKLIYESWQISQQANTHPHSNSLVQRHRTYTAWVFNEIFALPARYFLNPLNARKLKIAINKYIHKYIKNSVSNDFGKW